MTASAALVLALCAAAWSADAPAAAGSPYHGIHGNEHSSREPDDGDAKDGDAAGATDGATTGATTSATADEKTSASTDAGPNSFTPLPLSGFDPGVGGGGGDSLKPLKTDSSSQPSFAAGTAGGARAAPARPAVLSAPADAGGNCPEDSYERRPYSAKDKLYLSQAIIMNNPPDLASWPVTTTITRLEIGPGGVHAEFSKREGPDRWKDVTPPGWDGPLQYTLGMAEYINGKWYASAVIQFWHGLYASGGEPQNYKKNWFYAPDRWGPMCNHQPAVGEEIGFFVAAGNVRNLRDASQSPSRERSNVVLVRMPGPQGASFNFPGK